jgi:hypothetical protein
MKKEILFLATALLIGGSAMAQNVTRPAADGVVELSKKKVNAVESVRPVNAPIGAVASPAVKGEKKESIKFVTEEHNFGTIAEGPAVSYDFEFTNTSKKPIQLESVRASCGCTTPFWSKEEILPGKSSKITATYNTKGRPGSFYKTITVKSTVGQKVLKIKGNVEKAPSSSVPTNNNSMIKH